ncbi:unnamed protein product, partial [Staurois parvus]
RIPFTGTKGPSPTPEKQPHTIIPPPPPPPPNFTLRTMQSGKYCSPGNHQTQTHPLDFQTRKCYWSLQRTHLHCSRVWWGCAFIPLHLTLCIALDDGGLDVAVRPWKPIP